MMNQHIFASSTSITSDAVCLSFLLDESQKRLSIFMPVHMLAFCVTSFSFVSSIFSKSIFVVEIPRAAIPYCFCINLALLPKTFVPPSLSLNFSTSYIIVVCIATSPLGRVCGARSFVVVILFSMRYTSILFATFSGACFLIFSAESLWLSFTTSSFCLL